MKRIASVAVMAGDRLLIGKRSDDQRWNLPGGHVDEGETPEEGAARELKEETGIDADPERLMRLREPQRVTTFTGKQMEIHSYLLVLPEVCDTVREGSDPGEAHDWAWTNISNGLPPDIAQNWHNKTDSTMEALGLYVCTNDAMTKSDEEPLFKAWPRHYHRVKGQTSDEGVSSKKQYRYMQAMAAEGDKDAKSYLANSPKGGEGLPENGKGRESDKRKGKKKDKAEKADAAPRLSDLSADVARVKAKYQEKKPKTMTQQVADIKARYSKPMEKSSDLFYARIEGLLTKNVISEETISHLMDAEIMMRSTNDVAAHDAIMKAADRLFDGVMSKEEQAVYELAYLAKEGCEESEIALAKFAEEMYEELLKHTPVEDAVAALVKAKICADADDMVEEHKRVVRVLRSPSHADDKREVKTQAKELEEYKDKAKKADGYAEVPKVCTSCKKGTPKLKGKTKEYGMHMTWWDCPHCETTGVATNDKEMEEFGKSADNSRVVGKKNGHSVRKVHGYYRYTSGPKRGEYVHRHEAEKRLGRKLSSKEHVDHKNGNRASTKNTKVMSASDHAAKTNKTRANKKGYSGGKRYEHTRDS